jgi:hypothetical protein
MLSLQASINVGHEIQVILPETSDHVSSCVSSTMFEDMKRPNQIDRHNPFIDHRSLVVADISDPVCSIPSITDDASTEPICTDSFSSVVTGSTKLIEVRTAESASSSNPDIQLSEQGNGDSENLASKEITEAVDEAAFATSSPRNNNGENKSKCDDDGIADVHGINQIDEENGTVTDNAASKTLAQFDSTVAQTVPESSRSTARIGNDDLDESTFFGPSIMSTPVSNSGHIVYSGNISLRSDSSTTSTRSFAFPV